MKNIDLDKSISNSTKWAFITEVSSKVVAPISNMILARILVPDAFGILATIQMVLSFADMLSDAGFQKYLIQKEFSSDDEKNKTILVAMYTSVLIACLIWGVLAVYNKEIAVIVGNKGLGHVLVISGINIPLVALSSVHLAYFRREFRFKFLLYVRMIKVFIPLLVTVPLALLGYGFWSLVLSSIISQTIQTIYIYFKSDIKLKMFYNVTILKNMSSFSIWSLIESIFIWLTTWCDVFILTNAFSSYYIGIYKMSLVNIDAFLGIISGSIRPVLYSALSRLQDDETRFKKILFKVNQRTAILLIPLGFGLYCYRDIARLVLFGSNWNDADLMLGLSGFSNCILIIYSYFCSDVYRAKGKPQISTIVQILYMAILVPTLYCYSYSFQSLVIARNVACFSIIAINFFFMLYIIKINPFEFLKKSWHYIFSSLIVSIVVVYSRSFFCNIYFDVFSILISVFFYFLILLIFKNERELLKSIILSRNLFV